MGPPAMRQAGCAEILERIAANIDARRFNPAFPANFPRFVQHAVWRSAPRAGSTSAMAGRSMIASAAPAPSARCFGCATAYP